MNYFNLPNVSPFSDHAIIPLPEEPLWVPHDPDIVQQRTPKWKPDEGFDIYIDQLRFIPDHATIVKVRNSLST